MIFTSLHPASAILCENKIQIALRISEDDETLKANHNITWLVTGDQARIENNVTITNDAGITNNTLTVDDNISGSGEIYIKVSSTEIYCIGRWYALMGEGGQQIRFNPETSGEQLASPDIHTLAASASTRSDGQNTLTIHYPGRNSVMPYSTTFAVWARYTDASGAGIADQAVIPVISGDFKLAAQGPWFTDANGWVTILVTTIGQINQYNLGPEGNSPPDGDSYGNINVSIYNTSISDNMPLHASASAGGPGLISYEVIPVMPQLDGKNNNLVLIKLHYRNCDGTPAAYRDLSLVAFTFDYSVTILYDRMTTDVSGYTYSLVKVYANAGSVFILQGVNAYGPTGKDEFLCKFPSVPLSSYRYKGYLASTLRDQYDFIVPQIFNDGWFTALEVKYVPYPPNTIPVGHVVSVTSLDPRFKVYFPELGTLDAEGKASIPTAVSSDSDLYFVCAVIYQVTDKESGAVLASGADLIGATSPDYYTWKSKRRWNLQVTPDGSSVLGDNEPRGITVTYRREDNTPVVGRVVQVTLRQGRGASGSDKLVTLDPPEPQATDEQGQIHFTVSAPYMAPQAQFWLDAKAYNPETAQFDTGSCYIYTSFDKKTVIPVTVTSPESLPLTLNAPHKLKATCLLSTNKPAKNVQLFWSAIPDDYVTFSPLSSTTDEQGVAEVEVTVWGSDEQPDTLVYARFYDDTVQQWQTGMLTLTWQAGEQPAEHQGFIALVSIDGTPVLTGESHLLKATYTDLTTNQPFPNQSVDWSLTPAKGITLALSTSTTDDNGATVNEAVGSLTASQDSIITITASAINPYTGKKESSSLPVPFSRTPVQLPGAGHISLQINNGSPFIDEGQRAPVVAKYTYADGSAAQGQTIYWAAFPSDRIVFGDDDVSSQTNENGEAFTTVTGYGPGDIDGAILSASAENDTTGTNDSAQAIVHFIDASPVQPWDGIELNNAFANNPPVGLVVNPHKSSQIIKAKMTTSKPNQSIVLSAQPVNPTLKMYNEQGELLPRKDEGYTLTSGQDGHATVLIGSQNPALCKLQAQTGSESPIFAPIAIATVSRDFAGALPPPIVRVLINGNIDIPSANNGNPTTFKLYIPASSSSSKEDMLTVIVNNRLAYLNTLEGAQTTGIDIAYALLEPGAKNQVAYLINREGTVYESTILAFTVTGVAQTGPDSSVTRPLPAPVLSSSKRIIEASDIIDGLTVLVAPYPRLQEGDVVDVYFYLSGQDYLGGKPASNIVKRSHTVKQGDLLSAGEPQPVVLPQALAAGYGGGRGTLQVDYGVTQSNGEICWSKVIKVGLKTTF
jgi:hypothetical protein